ncbi:energy-coupling factor transporter transmembrane component T family protein [Campylobacter geochelonis]|uniref:energy-coupling factor transporter transmembrane component T family protein n=1 Tax=Campylobacter geochelonis TaxID=1780362 RepID=UPI000770AFCE|nr:energy-coupling factor transporter transmembrane component T [Campylobacter geochelonis]CZE47687.1 putative cobalt ABC transporter CbiQ%2C permease subunit [Campylobacter geochelonis]
MSRASFFLICFAFFSCFVAFLKALNFTLFLPLIYMAILHYELLFNVFKKAFFLNIFAVIIALSVAIYGSLSDALLIFLRFNLIVCFGLLLFCKFDIFIISKAIADLKFSAKISSLFYFIARFIDELKKDFVTIKKTLKARGFMPKTSLFTYKIYANLTGLLLISAFYKSKQLEKALIARSFSGQIYTIDKKNELGFKEAVLGVLVVFSFIYTIWRMS